MSETNYDLEALRRYHAFTREHGVDKRVYLALRIILQPFILIWFSLKREGQENIPEKGPLLILCNHRSFLDPFLVGVAMPWNRPLHFMAKAELFSNPVIGWILNRGGAFPVRRGESDSDTTETAQIILERGGDVCLFPEGTRMRYGGLGQVRRGAGRLALLTGVPVLPVVVKGTEKTRKGFLVLPRHCQIALERPVTIQRSAPTPEDAETVMKLIWDIIGRRWLAMGGSKEAGQRKKPKRNHQLADDQTSWREKGKRCLRRSNKRA